MDDIQIHHLSSHPEIIPKLASWLKSEWPSWYGEGGNGNAEKDLRSYSSQNSIPIGLVAYRYGEPCGFAVLKSETISGFEHLTPWAGAGFVLPSMRNRGIGSKLLYSLEIEAKKLGYHHIYCGTVTASNLLYRTGWHETGTACHNGDMVTVYEKAL